MYFFYFLIHHFKQLKFSVVYLFNYFYILNCLGFVFSVFVPTVSILCILYFMYLFSCGLFRHYCHYCHLCCNYYCQLSAVSCQMSAVNCQVSTVNSQLSNINCFKSHLFTKDFQSCLPEMLKSAQKWVQLFPETANNVY